MEHDELPLEQGVLGDVLRFASGDVGHW